MYSATPSHVWSCTPPGGAHFGQVDGQGFGIAVNHCVECFLRECLQRVVEREIIAAPQHFQQQEQPVVAVFSERFDRAFAQRTFFVGDDFGNVAYRLDAQSVAVGAGSFW